MIEFDKTPEFDDDFSQLLERYTTLEEDFEKLKSVIKLRGPKHTPGTVRIHMGANIRDPIYKVRQFRCRSLSGKGNQSGFRIIFGHDEKTEKTTFIQIYHKNEHATEDKERIKRYFESA